MPSPTASAAASSGREPPRGGERLLRLLDRAAPALFTILVLLAWEAACRAFAIPPYLLPMPSAIARAALSYPALSWLASAWATLRVSVLGLALACAVAVPLAMALTASRLLSRTLYPLLVVVQSTPVVAVAPIIVVVLGAGDLPRIAITFLIAFFPIVVSTATGLAAAPEELIELSRSLGATRRREMLNIRLPFSIPYVFSALRISATLSVIGAVVAEFVAAENGLGYMIAFATSNFRLPLAFAALAVLIAFSLLLFQAMTAVQRLAFPWSLPPAARSRRARRARAQ